MRFKRSKIYLSVIPFVVVGYHRLYRRGDGHGGGLHFDPDHDFLLAVCRTSTVIVPPLYVLTAWSPWWFATIAAAVTTISSCGAGADSDVSRRDRREF